MQSASPAFRRRTESGFTLIELLVVIAIIGLLSSIVLASMNTARMKARDARRQTDLHQLFTAIESYYLDTGHYPGPIGCYSVKRGSGVEGYGLDGPLVQPALVGTYIPTIPVDPLWGSDGRSGNYMYWDNANSATLCAIMESSSGNGNSAPSSCGTVPAGYAYDYCLQFD